MKVLPHEALRLLNVLIVVSLLLGTVAPMADAAAQPEMIAEEVGNKQNAPSGQGEPPAANILAVVDVEGPLTVAPDEQVALQVRVVNVGVEPILGAQVQMREEPGAKVAGRSQQPLPDMLPGEQAFVEFSGKVVASPGEVLLVTFEVKGGGLDQEAIGHYQALVRQEVPDIWQPDPGENLWRVGEYLEIELTGEYDPDLAEISHRVLYEENAADPESVHQLELLAYNQLRQTLTQFSEPVIVRWYYMEALAEALPILPPQFDWWDPQVEAWQTLPTEVDLAQGYIETRIHHPGWFKVEDGIGEAEDDPFSGLDSDLFTGAATYHYPVPLLQRPNGFAPGLALNYSSRRRDAHHDFGSNGSLLGWGWRLDGLGRINWVAENLYKLELNGITYTINKGFDHGVNEPFWYAKEAPWLHITRAYDAPDSAPWHVRTPDGTRYDFEGKLEVLDCKDGSVSRDIKTYMLTSITDAADDYGDVFAYSMNIDYETSTRTVDIGGTCGDQEHVFEALPKTITYNGISTPYVWVDFAYENRTDKPVDCDDMQCSNKDDQHFYYYAQALKRIEVRVVNDSTIARAYDFTSSEHSNRWLLDSVQMLGKDGIAELPPTAFTYENESACDEEFSRNCMLEAIDNGQGGTANLQYKTRGGTYYLSDVQVEDAFGSPQTRAIWVDTWDSTANGFDFVIVTDKGDLITENDDRMSKHWYSVDGDEGSWGLEWQSTQESVEPSGVRLYWAQRVFDEPPLPEDTDYTNVRHVLLKQTTHVYDDAGANQQTASHTEYRYDPNHQGGHQNGNVTHIHEFLGGTTNLVRTTERKFYPTDNEPGVPGPSIRNRLAEEWVWEGNVGDTCKSYNRYYYDNQDYVAPPTKGLLTKVEGARTRCDSSGGDFITLVSNTYDTWNNLQRTEDALQHGMDYTYETEFHTFVATERNELGHEIITTYDSGDAVSRALGWPYQIEDANGQTTTYSYDAMGRPLTIDRPLGDAADESWAYYNYQVGTPRRVQHRVRDDVFGVDDYLNYLVTWTYSDGMGRTLQTQTEAEETGERIVQSYAYAQRGRLQRESLPYQNAGDPGSSYLPVTDWNGVIHTAYDYDPFSRISTVTNPDNTTLRTSYNHLTTTVFDELNHKTEQEADGLGRMIASRSYTGDGSDPYTLYATANYDYDVLDRLDQVTGPDGAVTDPSYNLLGWKTEMVDPSMGTWSYDHDDVGNLTYQVDARGCSTTMSYDELNRPRGKIYDGPGACGTTINVVYTYDEVGANQFGKGRRTGLNNGSSSTAWYYDERGRVRQETKTISGTGGGTFVTQWDYDAADRVKTMTYPDGEIVTYDYNAQGLANSMSGSASGDIVISSTYNAAGQPTERRLGTGSGVWYKQIFDYDPNTLRLTDLKAGNNWEEFNNLINMSYQYDAVGNVLSIEDVAASGGSQIQSFRENDGTPAYDELNRLKRAEAAGGSHGTYAPVTYSYDPNGNITTFEGKTYGYDASHPHRITTVDGVQQYWYDANGNVTRRIVPGLDHTLSYDAENRLVSITDTATSADVASYVYDGDGVRVLEVLPTLTRTFVGDHYEISGGSIRKYYSIDGARMAENLDGTLYFLLTDHLGSTALTTAREGGRYAELRYYPYGDNRYNTGGQITSYRYTGQRWASGTGLYWYRSRWYDPALGRFIQPDTIVPSPSDPQSLNRYASVLNNPIRYSDPTGHYAFEGDPDDQYFIPPGRSPVGQSIRMESDPCLGGCKTPTTAEFLSVVGAPFVAAGVAVAGEVILIDLAVPATQVGWVKLLETLGVACADGDCGNKGTKGLDAFSRAKEFGIRPFNQFGREIHGTGLQRHHLVEKRFAEILGRTSNEMLSVALTPEEHQVFTNAWRNAIGYINSANPINTATASRQQIWRAAQRIYAEYPELLQAAKQTIFGG